MKRKKALLFVLALLAMLTSTIAMVFAQDSEPEAPLAALFTNAAKIVPVAVLMAVATSILGYLRSTPPEKFELDKFLATIIISLIMGVLTLGFGWDYTVAEQWLANGCITLWIYWIAKIVALRVGWSKLPQPAAAT